MENINILFLGGAKRVSLAKRFIIAGLKLDIGIKIFSYELTKEVPIFSVAEVIVGKRWGDDDLVKHLLETIKIYDINIIIPCIDPAISLAAELKQMSLNIFIPVSEKRICEIMYDKCKSYDFFAALNVKLPSKDFDYPMIAKPRKGSASVGIKVLKNEQNYIHFKNEYQENDYLIQKYIEAEEYTVDAYVDKTGTLIGAIPRLRLEVYAGEVLKSLTIRDEGIINISAFILDQPGFFGPITIQFLKEKKTRINYLMEINTRVGGGIINSIEAGFDIPLYILKEYLEQELRVVQDWKENLFMTRAFQEVFFADYHRP